MKFDHMMVFICYFFFLRLPSTRLSDEYQDKHLQTLLGEGGFGKVYRCYNVLKDDTPKAIKIYPKDYVIKQDMLENLMNEIEFMKHMSKEMPALYPFLLYMKVAIIVQILLILLLPNILCQWQI